MFYTGNLSWVQLAQQFIRAWAGGAGAVGECHSVEMARSAGLHSDIMAFTRLNKTNLNKILTTTYYNAFKKKTMNKLLTIRGFVQFVLSF